MSHITPDRVRREVQGRFTPIRNLVPELLARALDQFRVGFLREASVMWEAMQNRDPFVKAVIAKRKKDVARHGWQILTVDDSPEAARHQEALENFYNNLTVTHALEQDQKGGLQLLLRQMIDAVAKGYAVHEIVWKPGPKLTAELRFVPLWFFEARLGRLRFLPQESATDGIDMPPEEWMVTVGEGLMEATSVAYMFKHLSLKDWLIYTEKFGVPGMLWQTDAAENSPQREAVEAAAASFGADWSAVCSRDVVVQMIEAARQGGEGPHQAIVHYMDKVIATLWRGGDLSTISQGSDNTGASLQGDESDLLLQDDARLLSETLNIRLDRHVIAYVFGLGVQPLAYIKVAVPEKEDVSLDLQVDQFLIGAGAPISVKDAMERYGRAMPEAGEPLLQARAPVQNPDETDEPGRRPALANEAELQKAARLQLAQALAKDLQPVRARLARILQISDAAIQREKLRALRAELDQSLARDLLADPASAAVIGATGVAALFNGMEKGTE